MLLSVAEKFPKSPKSSEDCWKSSSFVPCTELDSFFSFSKEPPKSPKSFVVDSSTLLSVAEKSPKSPKSLESCSESSTFVLCTECVSFFSFSEKSPKSLLFDGSVLLSVAEKFPKSPKSSEDCFELSAFVPCTEFDSFFSFSKEPPKSPKSFLVDRSALLSVVEKSPKPPKLSEACCKSFSFVLCTELGFETSASILCTEFVCFFSSKEPPILLKSLLVDSSALLLVAEKSPKSPKSLESCCESSTFVLCTECVSFFSFSEKSPKSLLFDGSVLLSVAEKSPKFSEDCECELSIVLLSINIGCLFSFCEKPPKSPKSLLSDGSSGLSVVENFLKSMESEECWFEYSFSSCVLWIGSSFSFSKEPPKSPKLLVFNGSVLFSVAEKSPKSQKLSDDCFECSTFVSLAVDNCCLFSFSEKLPKPSLVDGSVLLTVSENFPKP